MSKFHFHKVHPAIIPMKKSIFSKPHIESQASTAKKNVLKHNRLHHILNDWDKTGHYICHLSKNTVYKKSRPLTHQSSKNSSAISQKFKRAKNHFWWLGQTTGRRIFRLWLGKRQKRPKINLRYFFHAQQKTSELVFKKAGHSGLVIDQSRVYYIDFCSKRSNMVPTSSYRARITPIR